MVVLRTASAPTRFAPGIFALLDIPPPRHVLVIQFSILTIVFSMPFGRVLNVTVKDFALTAQSAPLGKSYYAILLKLQALFKAVNIRDEKITHVIQILFYLILKYNLL